MKDKIKINNKKFLNFLLLHVILFMYSISGICSKMASKQEFLSFKFILYYGLLLVILAVYAVLWQQVLKKIPLSVAYSNKAVTIVWGILWGVLIFKEHITLNMIIGGIIVLVGVVLVVSGDGESNE